MHERSACHVTGFVLAVSLTIGPAALRAQSPGQPAATCAREPHACPPHTSGPGFATLSVVNDNQGGVKSCKFVDHRLDPLITGIGSNASWQLCNACDLPVEVVLDTWDDNTWPSQFEGTSPLPSGDDESLTMPIGCHDTGSINAWRAKGPEGPDYTAHYKAHVRLTAASTFSDTIDPQLQIKRGGSLIRKIPMVGTHLLSLVLGLVLGYWGARWRRT